MRSPSVQALVKAFPKDLDRKSAGLIKRLAKADDSAVHLEALIINNCPETDKYARSLYRDGYASQMWRITLALHAMDEVMGTHGVESLSPEGDFSTSAPPYEYLNAGDTYATTLIYDRDKDRLFIGTYGDVVEKFPQSEGDY